jgi:hypothetical protein
MRYHKLEVAICDLKQKSFPEISEKRFCACKIQKLNHYTFKS